MNNQEVTILRIDAVVAITGLPKPTIYRLVKSGKFPKPHKLAERCSGWKSIHIRHWLNNLQQVEG